MPSNVELLTQTIPQLFALCDTIKEAAAHGAQNPSDAPAMKQDIVAGIATVEAAMQELGIQNLPEKTAEDEILNLQNNQILPFVVNWYQNQVGSRLANRFLELLKGEWQFQEETARKLASWVLNEMHLQPNGTRRVLLELGQRCNAWAPEFSWQLMSGVFDSMPPEEQKAMFPHWKGQPYRPGLHPQTELTRCPICGGSGKPYHAALSGRMNHFDTLFLPAKLWMRCEQCGNLYSRFFPTEFLQLGAKPKVLQPNPARMVVRQVSASSLHIWSTILNKIRTYTEGTSLLEVGVGEGHLIAVALEMGYNVTAVELLEKEAQETADLLRLPVICGDFLHIEEDQKVDIITMGDVIEHLQSPAEGLRKAHALLKDDGILWLSTPNYESSFTRMLQAFDPMWCEPYHLTYFSRSGLLALLEKVGFRLLEYTVSNRYNGSMELLLQKKAD